MITVKQAWVGLLILLLVMLMVVVFAVYWHHVTGVNPLHLLADGNGPIIQGC